MREEEMKEREISQNKKRGERTQNKINEQKEKAQEKSPAEGFLDTLPFLITKQGNGFHDFLPSGAHFLSFVLGSQSPCGWDQLGGSKEHWVPIPWQGPLLQGAWPRTSFRKEVTQHPKDAAQLMLPEGLESGLRQCWGSWA